MKILIVTTPIRPVPTDYPPFGVLSIVNYLRRNGVEGVEFYNIDQKRPGYDEALAHIEAVKPDVLGISAVVSTAYEFTKRLSVDVKARLPGTLIVGGGNLMASAEILLRRTGVDLCVTGEGEAVFLDVVRRAEKTLDPADFKDVPGLVLLNSGRLVNTGYTKPLAREEVYDIRWDDLFDVSPLEHYIYDPISGDGSGALLDHDPRSHEPHRRGKKVGVIHASKGCVAKCTFCHRWDKGIRYIPVDLLITRIRELIDRFDVGFLIFADENFGTDKRWLGEFCEKIKPLDLIWRVTGMRVNTITPDAITRMKDAGCVTIVYGMETGSERMLQVMEKKTKADQNRNAMQWTVDAGVFTVIQLVLGMPGESPETIRETIGFCRFGMTLSPAQNPNDLSINYAQALPGTPLYEFGRRRGLIGAGPDGEEDYLLRISDRDAHDETTTLNFTEYPMLEVQTWRPRIQIEVNREYVRKYGLDHYHRILLADAEYFEQEKEDDGYFANPKRLVERGLKADTVQNVKEAYAGGPRNKVPGVLELVRSGNLGLALICHPVLAHRFRAFLPLLVLLKAVRQGGAGYAGRLLREWLVFKLGLRKTGEVFRTGYKSLRKVVEKDLPALNGDAPETLPLRRGR